MRFVVDDQLPPALARLLETAGHLAEHVGDVDMTGASDKAIWNYARSVSAVIVTKDRDFSALRSLVPDGPSVVWIRTGNTRKRQLLENFTLALPLLVARLESGDKLVELQ
jgi:predicted nuclease of predicted toxin-antitoxin system